MLDTTKPFRCYRVNFLPYPKHTVALLTCTDWRGRTESDRRVNTWDLKLSSSDLADVPEHWALKFLIRELLDKLDPPEGDPWAEPPEPPDGGYRGDQLTLDADSWAS